MKVSTAIAGLIILLAFNLLFGAEEIPKFGKVSDEELQMTAIPEDPEADAVVLFDVGDLRIREGSEKYYLTVERHTRVKILTEKGKDYASVSIPSGMRTISTISKPTPSCPTAKKSRWIKKRCSKKKSTRPVIRNSPFPESRSAQ